MPGTQRGAPNTFGLEHVPVIEQRLTALEGDFQELKATVSNGFSDLRRWIEARSATSSETKKNIWAQAIPLLSMSGAILWLLMQLNVQNTTGPIGRDIVNIDARLRAVESTAASVAKTADAVDAALKQLSAGHDRNTQELRDINKAQTNLEGRYVASEADRQAKELEIETQFNAQSQLLNVQFATQQRTNHTMWNANKDKIGEYPSAPFFFPNISRPGSVPLNSQP